ncbi:chemotaxis protein chel [Roseomonas eburnea]|uniref:Chemotaxis protein chel n=1 Tax=Neoroseomonas eburnea TaxID=1346889 RepID=A0A9X9XAL7_9PROT|nr:rod-binding protein [Neoroseomonas eburnea]MBR0680753.1 chemotaxis protein chel [Neoroseomonas eburnea]
MEAPILPPVQPRALAAPAVAGSESAMRRAAEEFEAQAFAMLLQPIFSTADLSRSRFGGGAAEAQWQPMLVDAYAKAATRAGAGLGLADIVLREMHRIRAAATPANTEGTTP